jgi:hypothetical protein
MPAHILHFMVGNTQLLVFAPAPLVQSHEMRNQGTRDGTKVLKPPPKLMKTRYRCHGG